MSEGAGHDTDRDAALDEELSHRRGYAGEHRLPPAAAVLVAGVSYALLPQTLLFAPRLVIPAIEVVLLAAMILTHSTAASALTRWSRRATVALSALMILSNLIALGALVHALFGSAASGTALLVGAMQVWLTNVVGFALLYWELDRGGPVARREVSRDRLPPADWRFSQDENHDTVAEVAAGSSRTSGWIPLFIDYLYLSVTNSSAFSPTDTMPLSSRAKALMATQSTAALLVSLLVIARAVGSLGGS